MANTNGMKRLLLGAAVVVCGFVVDRAAFAISVAPSSGKGLIEDSSGNNSADCWILSGAQVRMNTTCGTNGLWTVFLPVNAGNHTASVHGAGGNFGTFCAYYIRAEGAPINSTIGGASFSWAAGAASVKSFSFSSPTNATVYIECIMNHDSVLNSVNYNQ